MYNKRIRSYTRGKDKDLEPKIIRNSTWQE